MADAAESPQVAASAESRANAVEISWILASDNKPWTVALAVPAAAHLRKAALDPPAGKERIRRPGENESGNPSRPDQSQPAGLVMAIGSPPTREAQRLLSLAPGPRPIVLATSDPWKLGRGCKSDRRKCCKSAAIRVPPSAEVAKRFWSQSREVVVALADDPEAVILGSAWPRGLMCRSCFANGNERAPRSRPYSRTCRSPECSSR